MTIRFAAAKPATRAHFATHPRRIGAFRAANDNHGGIANPALLRASLLHFAEHGLAAADIAGERARAALLAGDDTSSSQWIAICGAFDRRLAGRIAAEAEVD